MPHLRLPPILRLQRLAPAALLAVAFASCSKRRAPAAAFEEGGPGGPPSPEEGGRPGPEAAVDPRFPGHVVAIAWEVKVHQEPRLASPMIGYLRAGASVAASAAPASREGCSGGFYEIAPAGFVCVETNVATTDLAAPMARALARRPDPNARLPYLYGLIRTHSPIYSRLPTRAEAAHAEYGLRKHMEHWFRAADGAAFRPDYWVRGKSEPPEDPRVLWDETATRDVPPVFQAGAQPPGNLSGLIVERRLVVGQSQEHQGFAFVDTAVAEGRRYAISTDLLVVPVDRLRPIEGSDYHGVRIPGDIDVPFALIRRDGAFSYELRGEGEAAVMSHRERIPRRSAVKLTGKEQVVGDRRYYETADGRWISSSHASRIDGFKKPLTKWAQDGEHWIDVSIAGQTLVAFEGVKPVYATLVSTGEAGLGDPETTKSTVLGQFRIFAKHVSTTMSSEAVGEEFQLKDIPYVQYFQEGYALHAAYWHDDFGVPRSHGCVNLAPEDARFIFGFTAPAVPATWHGARAADKGSVVLVHK